MKSHCGETTTEHIQRNREERAEAERRVIAVRGSRDAPGFDACVEAELAAMAAE